MKISKHITDLLKSNDYENEVINFRSFVVKFLIITLICGAFSSLIFVAVADESWQYFMIGSYFQFFTAVVFYFLLKRMHFTTISVIYVVFNLLLSLYISYYDGGLRSPAFIGVFLSIIATTLIFNWRVSLSLSILAISIAVAFAIADINRFLPLETKTDKISYYAYYYSLIIFSIFIITASASFAFEKILKFAKNELNEKIATKSILAKKEKRLKNLLDNSPHAIFFRDINGNITYANPSAQKFSGYSIQELCETEFSKLLLEDEVEFEKNFWNETLLNKSAQREFAFKNKNGEIYYLHIYSQLDDNQEVFYYSQNITERKLADIKTSESLQAFQMIFEESPFILTLKTLDGVYVDVNKKFCTFYKISKNNVIGKTIEQFHSAKNLEPLKKMHLAFLENNFLENYEFVHITDDGTKYNAIASMKLIELNNVEYVLSALQNITQIKQFQKELELSNSYINRIISSIPSIVWQIKYVNGAPVDVFISDMVDKVLDMPAGFVNSDINKVYPYIHPEDREQFVNNIQMRGANPNDNLVYSFRIIDSKNKIKHINVKLAVYNDDNDSTTILGVGNDVTLSKEFEYY